MRQVGTSRLGVVQHFTGFFEEDLPHFVVFGQVDGHRLTRAHRLDARRGDFGLQAHWFGRG